MRDGHVERIGRRVDPAGAADDRRDLQRRIGDEIERQDARERGAVGHARLEERDVRRAAGAVRPGGEHVADIERGDLFDVARDERVIGGADLLLRRVACEASRPALPADPVGDRRLPEDGVHRVADPAGRDERARRVDAANELRRGAVRDVEDRDLRLGPVACGDAAVVAVGALAAAARSSRGSAGADAAVPRVAAAATLARDLARRRRVDEGAVAFDEQLPRFAGDRHRRDLVRALRRPRLDDAEARAVGDVDVLGVVLDEVGLVDAGDLVVRARDLLRAAGPVVAARAARHRRSGVLEPSARLGTQGLAAHRRDAIGASILERSAHVRLEVITDDGGERCSVGAEERGGERPLRGLARLLGPRRVQERLGLRLEACRVFGAGVCAGCRAAVAPGDDREEERRRKEKEGSLHGDSSYATSMPPARRRRSARCPQDRRPAVCQRVPSTTRGPRRRRIARDGGRRTHERPASSRRRGALSGTEAVRSLQRDLLDAPVAGGEEQVTVLP